MNAGHLKNTLIYASGDIIPKILVFISFPILTRYLTTEDYGIVNFVNTISMFLLVLSILNLNTYYLVNFHKLGSTYSKKKLLGNLTTFLFIYNLIILLITSFAGYLYDSKITSQVAFFPFIFIGVLSNFFNAFSILPLASFRLKENARAFASANIIKNILQLALTILFVVHLQLSSKGVLYSILIANVIFFFYYAFYSMRNAELTYNSHQIKEALTFSLPLVPGAIAYLLITLSDRILIAKYLSFDKLGIYSTAATLGLLINIISSGFYQALEPYIFKRYHETDFKPEFIRIRKLFYSILLVCSLGLALYSQEFLFYMSNESFHNAYIYVPPILLGGIFSGLNLIYSTTITARGNTKVNSFNIMIGCLASVVLNLLLIPLIGIWGAPTSFAIAFFIMLLLSIYKSKFPFLSKGELMIGGLWLLLVYIFVFMIKLPPGYITILLKGLTLISFIFIAGRLLGITSLKKLFGELIK